MKPRLQNDEEIERTLASINGLRQAEAPPFFYTRLQARIGRNEEPKQGFWMMVTRPAVSFAAVALLMLLNVAMIVRYVRSNEVSPTQKNKSGLEQFAEAYNLDGGTSFTDKTNER